MTILTLIRTLNLHGTRHGITKSAALAIELESYINDLIESGYFWEAYTTITADDTLLMGTDTRIECLGRIWQAIRRPDFMPGQYGLDVPTAKILEIDVLIAIGKAYFQTFLSVPFSKATIESIWTVHSAWKTVTSTIHKVDDSVTARLTRDGSPWGTPRQQLDCTYVSIMQRATSRNISKMADKLKIQGYQGLRDLHDQAVSTKYLGLAEDIRCILVQLHPGEISLFAQMGTSYTTSSQTSWSLSLQTASPTTPTALASWIRSFLAAQSPQPGSSTKIARTSTQRGWVACCKLISLSERM